MPPILSGDAEQQMKQMREYMTRVAMQLNEEEPAPQQVINQTQQQKKSTKPFTLNESQFLKIYPVGSIYLSVSNTSPSALFGGTWQQIKDTFLLAAGDTYEAGTVGGEAKHTLTEKELPNVQKPIIVGSSPLYYINTDASKSNNVAAISVTSNNNPLKTSALGSGEAHNNMPPYLAVYVWQRIS